VTAVRVPAQQTAAIFRETRPVTGFAVSGGIVRNTALPIATIEHASGRKIETTSVQAARTAPHAVSNGSKQWSVVAPEREVKAAVAARPQSATARNAPVEHESANAKVQKAPKAQKAPDASPIEAHRPPAEAPAAQRPQSGHSTDPGRPAESSSKQKPKHEPAVEKPVEQSARPPAAHKAEPNRPDPGPKPKATSDEGKPTAEPNRAAADKPAAHSAQPHPAQPAQKPKAKPPNEKPVQKEKPEGEKPPNTP
jgi:hypothetical protein